MNKKGFSLAELLLSLAILGILVLAITRLEEATRTAKKLTRLPEFRDDSATLVRLLADDVHRCEKIDKANASTAVMTIDGQRVEWVSGPRTVRRVHANDRHVWPLAGGISFSSSSPKILEVRFKNLRVSCYYSIRGGIS